MIHKFKNNKLNITDIRNTESKSKIQFWRENINRIKLDTKNDRNSDKNKNKKEKN